jgi:hypothetical protein
MYYTLPSDYAKAFFEDFGSVKQNELMVFDHFLNLMQKDI